MERRKLLKGLTACVLTAANGAAAEGTRTERAVLLGDTRVRIVVYEANIKSRRALVYFHPHENEHSSAVVARHTVREYGGRLVEIRSQGERLVTFRFEGKSYSFDPNRMFSDVGLESSLAHFAPMSRAPLDCARKLRDAVLDQLDNGKLPIAGVHNNTRDEVAIYAFQKNGMFEAQAAKIAINPKEKPQNFFVVSDPGAFGRLQHLGFNVVLEATNAPDDGSLRAYCRLKNWQYAVADTSEGAMSEQQRMLSALPFVFK